MKRFLTAAVLGTALIGAPFAASAKNAPNCPPGQQNCMQQSGKPGANPAQQGMKTGWHKGEKPPGGKRLDNPARYGLPDGSYVQNNGSVYRIDPDTGAILAIIGAVAELSN